MGGGDGEPSCSCEAVGPCTKRDSSPRSANLFVRSLWKHKSRAKDLKGLAGLRVDGGDGEPPCSCEAVGPCTKRDSSPRSTKLFVRSPCNHEGRAMDLKGLAGLRVGGGDGDPPCSCEAVSPCTKRDRPPRSAKLFLGFFCNHEGRAMDLKGLAGLRVSYKEKGKGKKKVRAQGC